MQVCKVKDQVVTDRYSVFHADCVDVLRALPDESVHLSIFSPPYSNLYVYSNHSRDVGNAKTDDIFYTHFQFVVSELLRVIKPGRIVAVDVMNIPAMKERDGYIGLKDFRGDVIRMFLAVGFIFHSEHCVWKDPLIEATRTKALGLMHKQLCKDSSMCRAGIPQYILAFRKPGANEEPIAHIEGLDTFAGDDPPTTGNLSHERWRRYASPVWTDIRFTHTLNAQAARDKNDERHVCPMALDLIERCVWLWSNPNDIVLDPFGGIGSTGYQALKMGRRAIMSELKDSYYRQNILNCQAALHCGDDMPLFATV